MKKIYMAPESEVIEMALSGVLAASNPKTETGFPHVDAPSMVFNDDIDDDYDEE